MALSSLYLLWVSVGRNKIICSWEVGIRWSECVVRVRPVEDPNSWALFRTLVVHSNSLA